jgi:hypothetical protein
MVVVRDASNNYAMNPWTTGKVIELEEIDAAVLKILASKRQIVATNNVLECLESMFRESFCRRCDLLETSKGHWPLSVNKCTDVTGTGPRQDKL